MNKPKTAAKLPQGRVMPEPYYAFLVGEEMFYRAAPYKNAKGTHHIILPMPALAVAKTGLANIRKHGLAALLKKPSRWERMTREQKVEAMAWTLYRANNPSPHVPLPSFSKWLKMWQGPRDAETKERAWLRPARQLLSLIQP